MSQQSTGSLPAKMRNTSSIHASIALVPAVLLGASFALDASQLLPSTITEPLSALIDKLPEQEVLNSLATSWCNGIGVLASILSAASGFGEISKVFEQQKQSRNEPVSETLGHAIEAAKKGDIEGVKLTRATSHATLNALVVSVAVFNWFSRKHDSIPPFNMVLSALALPVLLFSVVLGASLYHNYGVGQQRHTREQTGKKTE